MSAIEPRADRRLVRRLLPALMLLGAFLRCWRIDVQSFWDDEVATFRAAALSLKQIWTAIPIIDSNPPLIYTVLHVWRRFGETEWGMRSLAALLGTLSIPAAFFALRRLVGRRAALLAAFLLAVNPLAIYCGQETRYNTMVTLWTLLAVGMLLETVETGRRRGAVGLAAFASLALYTHYFAFFILGAMAVLLLVLTVDAWRGQRRNLPALAELSLIGLYTRSVEIRQRATILLATVVAAGRARLAGLVWAWLALAVAALSFVPFLKFFTVQLLRGVPYRDPLGLLETLQRMLVWTYVGHSVTAPPTFFAAVGAWAESRPALYLTLLALGTLPFAVAAVWGMVAGRRRFASACFVVLPFLGSLLVSRLLPIFDPRYMLPFVPFVLAATAAGLREWWQRRRKVAVATVAVWLLLLTGLSLKDYYYSPAHWRQDWRGLAARVAAEAEPNATVLFYNFYTSLAFLHYYDKEPARVPVAYLYVLEERFRPLEDKRRHVGQVLDGPAREARPVWLIDYHGYLDDPYDDVRAGLSARGYERLHRACRLSGLWQYCLERWAVAADDKLAVLRDAFDFKQAPPLDYQLAAGWYPGRGERRWIGERAGLRFRRPSSPVRLEIEFYANLEYLGGDLEVEVTADGRSIGLIEVAESREVQWRSAPFSAAPGDSAELLVELIPDRTFIPDRILGDGDQSAKSILVKSMAVRHAGE